MLDTSNFKKNVVFVTGTRADFGKLEPLIIKTRDSGFNVSIFITGMHLMKRYGMTKIEVNRLSGVQFTEFPNQKKNYTQDIILAKTISGFSNYVEKNKPDLVIIHGDRVEATACAIVCATHYIRCGHIEGGEVSGTIDEALRHCNTKLAHHHFVCSILAAQRVSRLGESLDSIHVIGSPELDYHNKSTGVSLNQVKEKYDIDFDDYGICIFHPVTSEQQDINKQAKNIYQSLRNSGRRFVVFLPNNDPGSEIIFDELNRLPKDRFRVIPSMRFSYFSELLRNSACIVGNSSTGVREAPFLGIPSLNLGSRQRGRASHPTITHLEDYGEQGIKKFLNAQWGKRMKPSYEYGDGNAASNFIKVLETKTFWNLTLQKQFCDIEQ